MCWEEKSRTPKRNILSEYMILSIRIYVYTHICIDLYNKKKRRKSMSWNVATCLSWPNQSRSNQKTNQSRISSNYANIIISSHVALAGEIITTFVFVVFLTLTSVN